MLACRMPALVNQSEVTSPIESADAIAAPVRKEQLVKNPYLVSKMVEVLFSFTWEYGPGGRHLESLCKAVFGTHSLLKQYLPLAIISFYVEVEKTGMSSQFYDKFGIRYNISQILKLMWSQYPGIYRDKMRADSETRWDIFVKFVNLQINDTTYLLDEGLGKLAEIHTMQMEFDTQKFQQLDNAARDEKLKHFADLERGAVSCI